MSKQAILKTLHYADIFDYPLTVGEIQKYSVERLTDEVLKEVLSLMTADKDLIYADPTSLKLRGASSYYCLPGREDTIELRKRREVWSRPKLEKAKQVASFLRFIPWIKLIGVTGALAMENSDEGDDIDLMIVTARERLWLTRGLVAAFLLLTGQYRRPGKIRDRICPNLMISENALEFPDRDLFTAHEIVQMKPIYDRENTYQKFLQVNEWVKEFLPDAIKSSKYKAQSAKPRAKLADSIGQLKTQNFLFDLLERFAYKLQLKYMAKKKTTEVTTANVARFHPHNARKRVLDEYQKRLYNLPK